MGYIHPLGIRPSRPNPINATIVNIRNESGTGKKLRHNSFIFLKSVITRHF
jgi:hypothetical protein